LGRQRTPAQFCCGRTALKIAPYRPNGVFDYQAKAPDFAQTRPDLEKTSYGFARMLGALDLYLQALEIGLRGEKTTDGSRRCCAKFFNLSPEQILGLMPSDSDQNGKSISFWKIARHRRQANGYVCRTMRANSRDKPADWRPIESRVKRSRNPGRQETRKIQNWSSDRV